ncbi:hypothetical protein PAXRUDRAFT_759252 [Paxillus rubicundulus Ve08.2h10]|uniref:Unplaced genomic scaffold scaffold_985, whole genome shotgun sequence n=1 Tax=Paxillus rubicundulus Ve08.2h10 TaxID=930991 RepID=A0A0D0CFB5_9AGAM|nr:hypothetical protein PAXRUDRAFT_759252 [Paxillus rubicundulus Ve08.2h10]
MTRVHPRRAGLPSHCRGHPSITARNLISSSSSRPTETPRPNTDDWARSSSTPASSGSSLETTPYQFPKILSIHLALGELPSPLRSLCACTMKIKYPFPHVQGLVFHPLVRMSRPCPALFGQCRMSAPFRTDASIFRSDHYLLETTPISFVRQCDQERPNLGNCGHGWTGRSQRTPRSLALLLVVMGCQSFHPGKRTH